MLKNDGNNAHQKIISSLSHPKILNHLEQSLIRILSHPLCYITTNKINKIFKHKIIKLLDCASIDNQLKKRKRAVHRNA